MGELQVISLPEYVMVGICVDRASGVNVALTTV